MAAHVCGNGRDVAIGVREQLEKVGDGRGEFARLEHWYASLRDHHRALGHATAASGVEFLAEQDLAWSQRSVESTMMTSKRRPVLATYFMPSAMMRSKRLSANTGFVNSGKWRLENSITEASISTWVSRLTDLCLSTSSATPQSPPPTISTSSA